MYDLIQTDEELLLGLDCILISKEAYFAISANPNFNHFSEQSLFFAACMVTNCHAPYVFPSPKISLLICGR